MNKALEELVHHRANERCEYCHFPEPPFHIEHIVAKKHGGPASEGNLALACIRCNAHKGPNLSGIDPDTRAVVELFNPRVHLWTEHFQWTGAVLAGLTPCGRATIVVLMINHPWRVKARERLMRQTEFKLP
jgi:hypothetical protein